MEVEVEVTLANGDRVYGNLISVDIDYKGVYVYLQDVIHLDSTEDSYYLCGKVDSIKVLR